jgi:hypothetical protein
MNLTQTPPHASLTKWPESTLAEERWYLERATSLLLEARECAKRAKCPGLLNKIRSAIKSAGGAERNFAGRERRERER